MLDDAHSGGRKNPPSPAERAAGAHIRRQIEGKFPNLKAFCQATEHDVNQLYRVTSGQQKVSSKLATHLKNKIGEDFEYWLKLVDNIHTISPTLFEEFGGVIEKSELKTDLEHEVLDLPEDNGAAKHTDTSDIYAPRVGNGDYIGTFRSASGVEFEMTDRTPRILIDSVAEAIKNSIPSRG